MSDRWVRLLLVGLMFGLTIFAYAVGWYRGVHQAQRDQQSVAVRGVREAPLAQAPRREAPIHVEPSMDSPRPISDVQGASLFDIGYEAARDDVDGAVYRIAEETDPAVEHDFIVGVFTYIARYFSPDDALGIYRQQGPAAQGPALRALVAEWISSDGELSEEEQNRAREVAFETRGDRLGLEVDLASVLATSAPGTDLVTAWLDAFSGHPGRSEMAARLVGEMIQESPDTVFGLSEEWTEWEQRRFETDVFETWALDSPESAWNWYVIGQDRFAANTASGILETWASVDIAAVQGLLNSLENADHRRAAVNAVATALAHQSTAEAVAWADQLGTPIEHHAAYQQILEETPRGIGVAISYTDGFPTVEQTIPGGPSAAFGLARGDLIVAVTQADGTTRSLYGDGIRSAVEQLRGDAGSEVQIHVLRPDAISGAIKEFDVWFTREQLLIERSAVEE